jgi:hypothetical protein
MTYILLKTLSAAARKYGVQTVLQALAHVCQARADELEKDGKALLALRWSLLTNQVDEFAQKMRGLIMAACLVLS